VFYAGGGTRIQVDAGVADSVDDLFDYLRQERKDAVSEASIPIIAMRWETALIGR
jgi:3-oxo-5alpha-steroid 4-dehydrogenase